MTVFQSLNQIARIAERKGVGAYLRVVAVGSGVRAVGLLSQIVVLVLLSRVLSKSDFGDMMTVFGFYRLAAAALGVGPSLVLLFHVSRRPDDGTMEIQLHRFSALLGAATSLAVAVAGFTAAGMIGDIFGKPGLAFWFRELAPLTVFSTLLVIATGALEGRSRISESIAVAEVIPNVLRIVCLPAVALLGLSAAWIAYTLILSAAVSWLWAARRLWQPSISGLRLWSAWDYKYCGKFAFSTLFAFQLNATDVLVAGALFSSEVVADYVIAARIASLFSFFQLITLKRFAPRAAHLLQTGNVPVLRREVELCRNLVVGSGALTIAGALCVAPFLLPIFGNYAGSQVFLTWLAVATFVQFFYATSDRLLIISGHTTVALVLTASSFLTLIIFPFATARWLGPVSIPLAMTLASIAFQPIVARQVKIMFGIQTIGLREVLLIACGCAGLISYALAPNWLSALAGCGVVGAISGYFLTTASGRSGIERGYA